ncbi:3'-5' exoribonuclease [Mycobacterium hackensackense]|uniref:3'-5' exoribonuclease domain-containing protein n=1 Tax=Mycobacterium hackensackense TaxID=228909 RepID=UPI002265B461|nr:3'-5' exoribonuclease [Mycobacterium hackensackense]MCV7255284.1 3'-5' exoribonuclease [Mycobacterium hackensackense]
MTVYCYDTEFIEDGKTIDLISIGIVADDGREYYAVNADCDFARACFSDWLWDNVVRHLPTTKKDWTDPNHARRITHLDRSAACVKPKWVIANEVRDFIVGDLIDRDETVSEEDWPELWAYYGAYDHVALCQLWGAMVDHPRFMPMYSHDIKQEMDRLGIRSAVEPQPANAHDALADARWNMAMLANHIMPAASRG